MEPSYQSNVTFDFTKNKKQERFFNEVMYAVAGKSDLRYFFYGGAIRGGKTSVCITILWMLAKMYPNSRWYIIRDSFTTLEATTIPSFEKFFPEGSNSIKKYNRNRANYYVELYNGSRIFFASESLNHDKDLSWMLGLEVNGIMLEQVESLSEKCWEKALERCGSWYINPMPPGLILSTFNPTLNWVKKKIYDKHVKGELKAPFYYINALPTDNPLVTDDQWSGWGQMDSISYNRFIKGDWSAFGVDKPFFYAFDPETHISKYTPNPNLQLIISFDFNKDPMTCLVGQSLNVRHLAIFDEIKVKDGSTPELCEMIIAKYPSWIGRIVVTGDASGHSRSPLVRGGLNHYIIIKKALMIKDYQMKVRKSNISHINSRMLCNSVLQNAEFSISENCEESITDLSATEVDEKGEIVKSQTAGRHFCDNVRYMIDAQFYDFISTPNKYKNVEK
jgi:hypothetical protein